MEVMDDGGSIAFFIVNWRVLFIVSQINTMFLFYLRIVSGFFPQGVAGVEVEPGGTGRFTRL